MRSKLRCAVTGVLSCKSAAFLCSIYPGWTTTTTHHGVRNLARRHMSVGGEDRRGQVRAAVSVCVRCHVNRFPYYLLVKRGKEPNKNMWSLPGGGLYFGEATLLGGMRELAEETVWKDGLLNELLWYPGTISTSESIGERFHYLIAHCFAEFVGETFPVIQAADDAADADWFTKAQIRDMEVVSNCKLNSKNCIIQYQMPLL